MPDKKIIAVIGATGAQGGGLARAILNDKNSSFDVRAITRKVDSDKAVALKNLGAEVVYADLDNEESVKSAFAGAYGAFCVTNFWEHFSPEKELTQAGNMAKAAKHAGLQHVIWSTLDDTRELLPISDGRMPVLMGKYNVPHFDAKGEANKLFTEFGLPATLLNTVFYWDNLIYFGLGPKRGEDGKLAITFPMGDAKLPSIAAEDIGKCAYGIFKKGNGFIGKTIGIAGGHPTGAEMASALTEALGQEVKYNAVPPDVYRSFGFPGADEMGNMFQFKADFNDYYCGSRSLEISRELNPELQDFKTWLNKNKSLIPIE
ncbi:MAG: nucleoside-diphosphate sugar epimerase [Ignavibacteria bacterium GWB2_35_12]|nr:MAG: nucleoside-diphosphate sugar epimerase [Ignavibacteria bacterium GWA2_35_8]OGU37877.1 MAG: nucleoside-diphosphate sugar epimerase [Ignavibacteria bacterium GWB2_35_12]OGU85798.1 MAG: nucleoside-diphosphate sugar epimerase [Ignavibacteria bacterium RIFOXYA2_FULL_35_10]OGV19661.1 MAG: nucleoside-diphosphate sugar epimerase [Ignavibacteria bacterium RIFOXYC2_FULL_35_21]